MNNEERIKSYMRLQKKVPDAIEVSEYLNIDLIETCRLINMIFVKLLIADKRGL